MTRDEVLAFVKANPVAFMATVERGKPRVRAMQTALIEPAGLVFCTGVQKDVHQQLVACGSVELAYWNAKSDVQVRVRGEMERVADATVTKRIVDEVFTFLKPIVAQYGYEIFTSFRLAKGTSIVWRMAQSSAPLEVAEF
ncbi:MAG: pyridoxamine 5'-phosphate oxidase family protein [Candidatus Bipolaricaulota bacterium]|nr:pyridoxamine 5'-phosphate oxidase family protein [Candidatus Bipolaricaulota bacterium]